MPVRFAVHHPRYLPNVSFFSRTEVVDVLVLLDDWPLPGAGSDNNLSRGDLRSYGHGGTVRLAVPIKRRPKGQLLSQVLIDPDRDWAREHWETIRRNYVKAPHFAELGPQVKEIYAGSWAHLVGFNTMAIQFCQDSLLIARSKIVLASSLDIAWQRGEDSILRIAERIGAREYAAGPVEHARMSLDRRDQLALSGLRLYSLATTYRPYAQTRSPFVPGLAVLDLLLNVGAGKSANEVLRGSTRAERV